MSFNWDEEGIPIQLIAKNIRCICDEGAIHYEIIQLIVSFDRIGEVEVYTEPFYKQFCKRVNLRWKQERLTYRQVADDLVEIYIYQYKKEYKNKRWFNVKLRAFKTDLIHMLEET